MIDNTSTAWTLCERRGLLVQPRLTNAMSSDFPLYLAMGAWHTALSHAMTRSWYRYLLKSCFRAKIFEGTRPK